MNRLKVWGYYSAYAVAFVVAFAVMLAVLSAAMICLPAGLLFGVVGAATLIMDSGFIVTDMSPQLMMFGGFFAVAASALCALLSVKGGIAMAHLFTAVRRRCDRLRGW